MTKDARMELWRERLEPLDASVHLNISADEHLPAGSENPWTTWTGKTLNRLAGSRVNMLKWGFSNEAETCDGDIRQIMQHILVWPMMNTACSIYQDLILQRLSIAIGCARHWEGTIWRICIYWWKDKNDDDHSLTEGIPSYPQSSRAPSLCIFNSYPLALCPSSISKKYSRFSPSSPFIVLNTSIISALVLRASSVTSMVCHVPNIPYLSVIPSSW